MVQIQREYVAGACNISKSEEALRWLAGWFGLGLTVAGTLAFLSLPVAHLWRLTLFLPALLGASGFVQATNHFCANYGLKGVFNVAAEVGVTSTVQEAEFAKKDRAKALQILGLSAGIAVVVALIVFLLP